MRKHLRTVCLVAVAATMMTACNGGNESTGWVDLGLPSGLLWATCNVGANAPEEAGNYYAWGETEPKDVYNWDTYKYTVLNNDEKRRLDSLQREFRVMAKKLLKGDGKIEVEAELLSARTTLNAKNDAAALVMGNGARTPSIDEWSELMFNTTRKEVQLNGVDVIQFIGPNGNSIFMPELPFAVDDTIEWFCCEYWTTTRCGDPYYAQSVSIWYDSMNGDDDTKWMMSGQNECCYGLPVRAVREGKNKK